MLQSTFSFFFPKCFYSPLDKYKIPAFATVHCVFAVFNILLAQQGIRISLHDNLNKKRKKNGKGHHQRVMQIVINWTHKCCIKYSNMIPV